MTTRDEDDPGRAAIRVAQSVMTLVRAEVELMAARAKAAGGNFAVTLALTAASLFLCGLAVIVIVLTPVLWTLRPSAAIGSLALAVGFALVASLVTLRRWRARTRPSATEDSIPPVHHELTGSDHAVPR
jgi:uncharacterized membrane protein YqjE